MVKLWRTLLVLSVVAIIGFGTVPAAYANCENSVIEYLQISPNGTVSQGTWLTVHGKGNCGTSKIQVNGQDKAEIGNNEVTTTIKTEEFPAGNLQICYLLRDDHDGGWGNAASVCQNIWVNAVPPRPAGTVPADINTYCMNQGYDRGYCPGNGYSCICERLNAQDSLDMYNLCEWQTGGQNPYPGLADFNVPAWTCNSSPAYVAQPPASPPNNPAPSNPAPSNPQPSSPNNGSGNNPPASGNNPPSGGSNPSSSGTSSPYSNVRVGDKAVVINSPSNSPLLCKSSAERGQGNVVSWITNGSVVTIQSGPYQNGGLYFWQVSGACNGYVADGQSGESWLQRQANTSSNPAPSNPAPSNPQPSNPAPSSGNSIPYTNARVGDDVQVVNSPSSNPLLCKSSAHRGQDNIISRITNGSRLTIIAGPWQDNGVYFVQVTGACIGYVATGQSGEMWIEKVESNDANSPSTTNAGALSIPYYHSIWDSSYVFKFDPTNCTITNGDEIVAQEANHLEISLSALNEPQKYVWATAYFMPNAIVTAGEIESFRQDVGLTLSAFAPNCEEFFYQVGTRQMDSSGLGNIMFGYFAAYMQLPIGWEEGISNTDQFFNPGSFAQFYDNSDDLVQRIVGRRLRENYQRPPTASEVISIAERFNLR